MKIRDKFKSNSSNQKIYYQTCEIKQVSSKKCGSGISGLLRICRHSHYQKYFSNNNKKLKTLWQGSHEIIYSKKAVKTNNP